jgi:hypothetical protein
MDLMQAHFNHGIVDPLCRAFLFKIERVIELEVVRIDRKSTRSLIPICSQSEP